MLEYLYKLRVSAFSQNWEENQPESSLPCISQIAKPQPFSLKFYLGEWDRKNNSAPWWGNQRQTRVTTTTCKHHDSCCNFSALKTRPQNPLSTQLLYAPDLKLIRHSSPHRGCLSLHLGKNNLWPRDSDLDLHIQVVLLSVILGKAVYLNPQNLSLSTRAPLISQLAYYLETKQTKNPIQSPLPSSPEHSP